jgi:hypothetical protein
VAFGASGLQGLCNFDAWLVVNQSTHEQASAS